MLGKKNGSCFCIGENATACLLVELVGTCEFPLLDCKQNLSNSSLSSISALLHASTHMGGAPRMLEWMNKWMNEWEYPSPHCLLKRPTKCWSYWRPPFTLKQLWAEVTKSVWVSDNPRQTLLLLWFKGPDPTCCLFLPSARSPSGATEESEEDDILNLQAVLRFLLAMKSWEFSPHFFSLLFLQYIRKGSSQESYCFLLA